MMASFPNEPSKEVEVAIVLWGKCLKSKPKDILKRPAAKAKGKSASKKAKPSQKLPVEQE